MASNFGKFTGNTIGEAAAFAAGVAIAPLLEPIVQELKNQTWSQAPDRPLDPNTVAQAVAEGLLTLGKASDEAKMSGIAPTPFAMLADLARRAPGVSEALTLLRRNAIAPEGAHVTTEQLHLAYRKAAIDPQWWPALDALATVPLTPAQIALGMVRSVIDDQGLLVRKLDTSDSNIPQYTPYSGDGVAEALAQGVDRERLRVLVGEIGLPMAVIAAAQLHFRGGLTLGGYYQAVEEGDVRPEWADAYLEYARQIPTAHDGIEDHLRGWSDANAMYAMTARHGMSQADTDILFRITGRPLSWHQVFIGLRRGGTYDGPTDELDPAFLKALRESNIRPEWYNLAWAQRFSYPAAFVLRKLAQDGDISEAETEQILLFEGWEPTLAKKVAGKWSAGTAAAPATQTRSATSRAVTAVAKAYIAARTSRTQAEDELTKLGVDRATFDELFTAWDVNREATIAAMTNLQIRNAFRNFSLTEADALTRLEARGLTAAQALAYLTAKPGTSPATG